MAKKKVADQLVDVLAQAGVRRIFGVSGDSLNALPTRFEPPDSWTGSICVMKKQQRLPRARKPISRESWRFVPEAAAPEICI